MIFGNSNQSTEHKPQGIVDVSINTLDTTNTGTSLGILWLIRFQNIDPAGLHNINSIKHCFLRPESPASGLLLFNLALRQLYETHEIPALFSWVIQTGQR